MQLDVHVPRFTWPGGPEAIGPTFASLARTAEAIGVRTLSVMDHWFQMDMLWPARGADARGLHGPLLCRSQDRAPAVPAPGRAA